MAEGKCRSANWSGPNSRTSSGSPATSLIPWSSGACGGPFPIRLDGKTGERWVRLADRALEWLEGIKPEAPAGRILPVARITAVVDRREVLKSCCEAAGVPYLQPKQVRAMVENRLYGAGGDPDAVAKFMGHTTEVSLRNYRDAKKRRINEVLEAAGIGERPDEEAVVSLAEHRRKRDAGAD